MGSIIFGKGWVDYICGIDGGLCLWKKSVSRVLHEASAMKNSCDSDPSSRHVVVILVNILFDFYDCEQSICSVCTCVNLESVYVFA